MPTPSERCVARCGAALPVYEPVGLEMRPTVTHGLRCMLPRDHEGPHETLRDGQPYQFTDAHLA